MSLANGASRAALIAGMLILTLLMGPLGLGVYLAVRAAPAR